MKLIPGISTHFIVISEGIYGLDGITIGKVYEIIKWDDTIFHFWDDSRSWRSWIDVYIVVEDASFEENLKNILSE